MFGLKENDNASVGFIPHRSYRVLVNYIQSNEKTLFFELAFRLIEIRNTYYNFLLGVPNNKKILK